MLYLISFLLLEIVKRIASPLLYPLAYILRRKLRDTRIVWLDLLYGPTFKPLWFFLDDSIHIEQGREYDDKEKRYPAWLWMHRTNFLLSWWWSAVRNSCVNWGNYCAYMLGEYEADIDDIAGRRNFIIRRKFKGGVRPYCEFWMAGRWNQIGWIKGGRFEIDIMKKRG